MNEARMIKKYPNRRLYDTSISSYITLEDVKRLVKQHINFVIQDAKTGEDITRNILLQIILEQEQTSESYLFSSEVLSQLIRFYGDTFQGLVANYFEKSLILFAKQQDEFQEKMYNPLSLMAKITEQNISLWKDMQEKFFQTALGGVTSGSYKKEDKNQKNSEEISSSSHE